MIVSLPFPATLEDLMKFDGKAELIGGRIVEGMPTGRRPNRIAGRIYRHLCDCVEETEIGEAFTDNMGFAIDPPLLSGRQSFSPDASFHLGPFPPNDMSFIDGPPTFAVEVRSENDCGRSAETAMADKRADYFEAGTLAVWDVDPLAKTITLHTPTSEVVFRPGDRAHAEPALSGWTLDVSALFG
jgi:Uma2 family endonuclease